MSQTGRIVITRSLIVLAAGMISLASLSCASSSSVHETHTKAVVASPKVDTLAALQATDEARTIRHNQAVQQSKEWTREAQKAQRDNNLDHALDLYTRAANLDPGNSAAVQGRDQILTIQSRLPPRAIASVDLDGHNGGAKGEISYQVQSNLDTAKSAIERGEWQTAETAIGRSRLAAAADPSSFTREEMLDFHNRIDQMELELQKAMGKAHPTQK
jgi:hypothetical protein